MSDLYGRNGTQNNPQVNQAFPTFGDIQPGGTAPTSAPQAQARPAQQSMLQDRASLMVEDAALRARGGGQSRQPAQQPQTFRQMQMQGQARPPQPQPQAQGSQGAYGPPAQQQAYQPTQQQQTYQQQASTPQWAYGGSPLSGQTQALLSKTMANPTAYNSDVIQAQRVAGQGAIEQGYQADQARLNEEMAARGIFGSSIAGGRMGDLMGQKQQALAQQEAGFLQQQAGAMDAGTQAALGMGLSYDQNQAGNALQGYGLSLQQQGLNQDNAYRYAQLGQQGQQFNQNLSQQGSQFDRSLNQGDTQFNQNLGQRQNEFNSNYGLARDQFNTGNQQWNQNFGEQQRQFDTGANQWDRQFGQNQQNYDRNFGLADRGMTQNETNSYFNNMGQLYGDYADSGIVQTGYDPYGQQVPQPQYDPYGQQGYSAQYYGNG
jgi:hypothetical protein